MKFLNITAKLLKDKKSLSVIICSLILFIGFLLFGIDKDKQKSNKGVNENNHQENVKGYRVLLNDKEIGIVSNIDKINILLNNIKTELEEINNTEIYINQELITYKEALVNENDFTPNSDLEKNLKNNVPFKVKVFPINIDGTDVAYLKTKSEAEKVIENIKSLFLPTDTDNRKVKIKSVNICEDIIIDSKLVDINNILSVDDALKYILKGTMEDKIYTVEKGDSLWSIANKYDMSVDEIVKANPDINPELIHIGDEINLVVPKPFINIEVKYEYTYKQSIPYQVVVKKDPNLERNKAKKQKYGKYGEKEVTVEVVENNGVLVSKEVLNEKIISEPVTEVVIQGTKRLPVDELMVAFLPKGTGILTSRFGMRWGRHHNGIDAAVPVGTPVYSYMAGTVKFSGWKSGYGYLIIIDHENGYETYYGHNSKLLVKKGDKVDKRQVIALSGNTGRSTGPHVHFEIHKNGVPIDPLKLLQNN